MADPIQTPEDGTEQVEQPTQTPAEPSQPTPPPVDWETKFKESQRENQILRDAEQARKTAEQESTKEPTDSDLRTAFPLWDSYDEVQKDFARRTFAAERTAGSAVRIAQQLQSNSSWATSIELAIGSNPALQGREQAFRQFASQPKYQGADMGLLIDAFLHKNAPAAPSTPTPPKPGLESGTGGPKTPEKPKLLTADELKALRTSDPRAYEAYIRTHDLSQMEL